MRLRDLSSSEIRDRLRHDGLPLAIGPFVVQGFSDVASVAAAVETLYADYPVVDTEFVDFLFGVHRVSLWKRWLVDDVDVTAEGGQLFDALPRQNAVAYWEWGINRCVANHAQHYLMLHAAVVARGRRGLIIVGGSGAGKSTLCAGLMLDGWRLLSDEFAITPLREANGLATQLVPLVKPIALKNESLQVVRTLRSDVVIGPLSPDTVKGAVAHVKPDSESVAMGATPASPAAIVFVKYRPGSQVCLQRVTRGRAMYRLAQNSFNFGLTGRLGFETLAEIVDQSEVFDLTYSDMHEVRNVLREQLDGVAAAHLEVKR